MAKLSNKKRKNNPLQTKKFGKISQTNVIKTKAYKQNLLVDKGPKLKAHPGCSITKHRTFHILKRKNFEQI